MQGSLKTLHRVCFFLKFLFVAILKKLLMQYDSAAQAGGRSAVAGGRKDQRW